MFRLAVDSIVRRTTRLKAGNHMPGKPIVLLISVLTFAFIGSCMTLSPPSPTPTSEVTETPVASVTSEPPSPPSPTQISDLVSVSVYFTDVNRYAVGTEPFEAAVTRMVPSSSNLAEAVLLAFFEGPTIEEREQGLEAITSGFDGVGSLVIENGVARVFLTGECGSMGATYTIAQPIMKNLLQFPNVSYVKIYDENGETEVPEGDSSSIPFCLEP